MQGPVRLAVMGRHELVADRLVDRFGQPRELADVEIDPAMQVVLGLLRHQQHLGGDHAGLGHQTAAGFGHDADA